jgi:hypothetical protein
MVTAFDVPKDHQHGPCSHGEEEGGGGTVAGSTRG